MNNNHTLECNYKMLMVQLINVYDRKSNQLDATVTNKCRVQFLQAFDEYAGAFILDYQNLNINESVIPLLVPLVDWSFDPFTHRMQFGD